MNWELLEKVLEYLKTTGEALAKSGFQIAYIQAFNTGIAQIITGVILLIIATILLILGLKKLDDETKVVVMFVAVPYFFGGLCLYYGTLMVLNPAWYAVEMILNTIK